jgi:hypothetical protein
MRKQLCPSLYQVNTRASLTELSRALSRPATLDDVPDAELDWLAKITLSSHLHIVTRNAGTETGRDSQAVGPKAYRATVNRRPKEIGK